MFDSPAELTTSGTATLQLDVTAPVSEMNYEMQHTVHIYGAVDVLLSNAGYAEPGPVEHLESSYLPLRSFVSEHS